ncbi:MAG: aspartate-semialdehyde dehydrogenase [Firmicutes bacterium]|nr:aspartate-semialdehyde dehydrogenase [Bacillota bacterium]
MAGYRVAVVGATGAVGRTLVQVLAERSFPVSDLKLYATERSVGTGIRFGNELLEVRRLDEGELDGTEFAFFCATAEVSRRLAPRLASRGTVVIDKSSHFRMDPGVPLIVPEVNAEALRHHAGIISSPNCSTIQVVVAVNPIHLMSPVRRMVVATYQAVSGTGLDGVDELSRQSRAALEGAEASGSVYPRRIAFNVIPQIDAFEPSGFTGEEMKLVRETRKIMGDEGIKITATCVRVPVFHCHSEAVILETRDPLDANEVLEQLEKAPGVRLSRGESGYHTPAECAGRDEVFVSRVRQDPCLENGLSMWVVADNLRKGAATNAVQIAECIAGR